MKRFALSFALLLTLALALSAAPAHAAFVESSGKVTLIRVQDVGSLYGPPGDVLDVDVIFTLSTLPGKAFGFQLRPGSNELTRQGMLDLLRDAFNNNWTVVINYAIDPGKNNGLVSRVWIVR